MEQKNTNTKWQIKRDKKAVIFNGIWKELPDNTELLLNDYYHDPVKKKSFNIKETWPNSCNHFLLDFKKFMEEKELSYLIKTVQKKGTFIIKNPPTED